MADHGYGVEHSGNTPGGETLIILNGPIIKQLGFNYTQGVMRDGFIANTSVGRFWRLYLRNIAGFLPHKNDKATFGNTWRVVVAENEDVVKQIGWPSSSADFGFYPDDSTVMISRHTGGNHISSVSGATAEELMPYVCDAMVKQYSWQFMFSVGQGYNSNICLIMRASPRISSSARCATGRKSRRGIWRTNIKRGAYPSCITSPMTRTVWCRWCGSRKTF